MIGYDAILGRRRLVLTTALLLSVAGAIAWLTMPRQEDPPFPERFGFVSIAFPGADAETVERLVLEPVEEALAEVSELAKIDSVARAGVAFLELELADDVDDTDEAWRDVARSLDEARRAFPDRAGEPVLDSDQVAQHAVVLAVTGPADPMQLADAADRLESRLLRIPGVARVDVFGDPGEQVTIGYDEASARRLGLSPRALADMLAQRSQSVPGGELRIGGRVGIVRPSSDFSSTGELAATPIALAGGAAVPLSEIATVTRGPRTPATERVRVDGRAAVAIGVVPQPGIQMVKFGEDVRAALPELAAEIAPLSIEVVMFQPDFVSARIANLGGSLVTGIAIVAAVLIFAMGLRLGLIVSAVVPVVALASLAIYAQGGGILHQISIAALVLALGMLVDNAIVMAENIQWHVDRGIDPAQAARTSVRELAMPLLSATGTTIAAFIPMLLATGGTGDFTRALPIIVMITLAVSYLAALLVTPTLSTLFLRPRPRHTGPTERLGAVLGRSATRRPIAVVLVVAAAIAASVLSARFIDQQFFPASDRRLVLVELTLPEGAHIDEIDAASRAMEGFLEARPDVAKVASFIGRSAPRVYYNMQSRPSQPHRTELLVETTTLGAVDEIMAASRDFARAELPAVEVVARKLEQGPPVAAPIEVRVVGDDLGELRDGVERVVAALRDVPGAVDIRSDLGLGAPTVDVIIDDAAAARAGTSRAGVASAIHGHLRGHLVGELRDGDDPVEILVRSPAGEDTPTSALGTLGVDTKDGLEPLANLARVDVRWRPAAIRHRAGQRTARVYAQLAANTTYSTVLDALEPALAELELPPGVELELGGEKEGSADANAALLRAMPLAVMLLLFFLLFEFNSFRRLGIILVTVPLAAIGVVPGLLLAGQPFGFMSLLGVIALVGIVVNNAIVLIDVIDASRRRGNPVADAIVEAVAVRTRPILLTTVTTIAGLLPLAISESTLWPPLAWAMISGLTASTALSLVVVPALYTLLFGDRKRSASRL